LLLLKQEFPRLKAIQLPSYNIQYATKGSLLKLKLLLQTPRLISAIKKEKKVVKRLVEKEGIAGIISDNRFGVHHSKVPSVYLTHQLKVLSGITTPITSKIHQKIIQKFDECWIPDIANNGNLSGQLGHHHNSKIRIKYIGFLSRFKPQKSEKVNDLLVVLSGPEPQRTLLENILLKELVNFKGKVTFVRGIIGSNTKPSIGLKNVHIINYLNTDALEKEISKSGLIVARSGYSTIMDLAIMGSKAFFIPTPGQKEQEYLAKRLAKKLIAPYLTQANFSINDLKMSGNFTGFIMQKRTHLNLDLFKLFQGE